MNWDITVREGAGPIKLGMQRSQVRTSVGLSVVSFKKTPISETETDAFNDVPVHVYYRKDDTAEAIEFGPGSDPRLAGITLVGSPLVEVVNLLESQGGVVELEDDGFVDKVHGVAGFAPGSSDDQKAPLESVMVFADGYYD